MRSTGTATPSDNFFVIITPLNLLVINKWNSLWFFRQIGGIYGHFIILFINTYSAKWLGHTLILSFKVSIIPSSYWIEIFHIFFFIYKERTIIHFQNNIRYKLLNATVVWTFRSLSGNSILEEWDLKIMYVYL